MLQILFATDWDQFWQLWANENYSSKIFLQKQSKVLRLNEKCTQGIQAFIATDNLKAAQMPYSQFWFENQIIFVLLIVGPK